MNNKYAIIVAMLAVGFVIHSASADTSIPSWLQKITTKEPSLAQLEVAIAALEASLGTTQSRVTSKVTALS